MLLLLLVACHPAPNPDQDGDGYVAVAHGGDDCDDGAQRIHPGATEVPYDGVDQDCVGGDLADVDGDGVDAEHAGGRDCDDDDPQVSPDVAEIAYDGMDQDCSGGDLVDIDGDGDPALVVGGGDCDDEDPERSSLRVEECDGGGAVDEDCDGLTNAADPDLVDGIVVFRDADRDGFGDPATAVMTCPPPSSNYVVDSSDCDDSQSGVFPGATETPYDGVDQDCSGADSVDLDGDGVPAREAGGADCDDLDPAAFPGAPEDHDNPGDEDCDDLVDEAVVCADGTGDHRTVQEAVDAAPEGTGVELCPGRYAEGVVLSRSVQIGGGGAIPEDVVLDGDVGGAWAVGSSTSGIDVVLRNLSIEGGSGIYLAYARSVGIDLLSICDQGMHDAVSVTAVDTLAVVERSRICGGRLSLTGEEGSVLTFRKNLLDDADGAGSLYFGGDGSGATAYVENNLVVGGEWRFGDDSGRVDVSFRFNTYVGGVVLFDDPNGYAVSECVFSGVSPTSSVTGLWDWSYGATWSDPGCSTRVDWERVVLWDVPLPWVTSSWCQTDGYWCGETLYHDCSAESGIAYGSLFVDPRFVSDPQMGSYALDASSPAVDAGAGEDVDGSPADLGAFGGPGGGWYLEVPWPMP